MSNQKNLAQNEHHVILQPWLYKQTVNMHYGVQPLLYPIY